MGKNALFEGTLLDGAVIINVYGEKTLVTPIKESEVPGERCFFGSHYRNVISNTIYHVAETEQDNLRCVKPNVQNVERQTPEQIIKYITPDVIDKLVLDTFTDKDAVDFAKDIACKQNK